MFLDLVFVEPGEFCSAPTGRVGLDVGVMVRVAVADTGSVDVAVAVLLAVCVGLGVLEANGVLLDDGVCGGEVVLEIAGEAATSTGVLLARGVVSTANVPTV